MSYGSSYSRNGISTSITMSKEFPLPALPNQFSYDNSAHQPVWDEARKLVEAITSEWVYEGTKLLTASITRRRFPVDMLVVTMVGERNT